MSHSPLPESTSAKAKPEESPDFLQTFLAQREQMESILRRRVGCRAVAADLIQDLFLRFWKRPSVVLEEPRTYLLRSAHNLAIDYLRSEAVRNRALVDVALEQTEPSTSLEANAIAEEQIYQALQALPERTRTIFLLSRVYGHTYNEIAKVVGISTSSVEKHMMRALEACQAHSDLPPDRKS